MAKFINPLLPENTPLLESNPSKISAKQLIFAGLGAVLAGAVLKKTGHDKAGAFVAGLALPILTTACYKKFREKKSENFNKSTDIAGNYY
ncbi:PrgI family protein [Flavobacterium poyangense]|uniref:PrgI family protein n=1 Tax=Flavobacterium poyangense TaxID=2204302 RepID=UPI001423859B|nr:PrgI family protein [Flavobacterium sp. JXAS1]